MERKALGCLSAEGIVNDEAQTLQRGVAELGLQNTERQVESLVHYLEQLDVTNRSFNLTRIPRAEYVTLHLLDSLTAARAIEPRPGLRVLDIGTGAGFPGVPLAAIMPDSHVTLLDSTAKKVRFAEETAHACGITNCRGIHARAEALAKQDEHRGAYDVVVSRAVASFDTLIQLMLPLTRKGGRAIALKGSNYEAELAGSERTLQRLGGGAPRVIRVHLPETDIDRYLIVVDRKR